MKRIIIIIAIILVVVGIFLTGAWLISRHTAQVNNTSKPTFKQFITGDTGTGATPGNGNGDLSSVFVDDNIGNVGTNTNNNGAPSTPTSGTQSAVFTNDTSTPTNTGTSSTGTTGGGVSGGIGSTTPPPGSPNTPTVITTPGTTPGTIVTTTVDSNGNSTTTTTTTSVDPTTQAPAPVPPAAPGPACTDADLNIQFTQSDLAKLQVLQNRFYIVAQALHTDADVATEIGNHDNYKARIDKITELYNYCKSKTYEPTAATAGHVITNPWYTKRIPTPFWHITTQDSELFTNPAGTYDGYIDYREPGTPCPTFFNPNLCPSTTPASSLDLGQRSLERSLRLNLW